MKKVLFFGLLAAFGMMTFVACDQTDNPANPGTPDNPGTSEPSALETYYFSVENGSYVAEEFPAQTVDEMNVDKVRELREIHSAGNKAFKKLFDVSLLIRLL